MFAVKSSRPQVRQASRTLLWFGLGAACYVVLAGWWVLAQLRAFEGELQGKLELAAQVASSAVQVTARDLQAQVLRGEGALLDKSGHFLKPPALRTMPLLSFPSASDEQGAWLLWLAAAEEAPGGDILEAERLYTAAQGVPRERLCQALAKHRQAAMQRRRGESASARATDANFLALLKGEELLTREALLARALATPVDSRLQADLLACIGGADEWVALGLLRASGLENQELLVGRRQEVDFFARMEPRLALVCAQAQGILIEGGELVAWSRLPAGEICLSSAALPTLPSECALAPPGSSTGSASRWTRYAPLGALFPGYSVFAAFSPEEVEARRGRQRLWLGLALLALVSSAGLAFFATLSGLRQERESLQAQSAFVARVGHDLRTPLSVMRMYAETLAEDRVVERAQAREFLEVIASEATRLGKLVQDMLDLSRTEQGQRSRWRMVDLRRLVEELVRTHRPLLAQAGLELRAQIGAGEMVFFGDEDALRGALGNLLENCLQHAAVGREAEVQLEAGGAEVFLSVQDRGPGLDPELGEHAFERFVRGRNAPARGAGLGLALVREVAQAHGGRAVAQPRPGGGLMVRLILPRTTCTPSPV